MPGTWLSYGRSDSIQSEQPVNSTWHSTQSFAEKTIFPAEILKSKIIQAAD
jgi:hypothetical protein